VVLIFTDADGPTVNYNIDDLCAQGVTIYVMQNGCMRNGSAFANGQVTGCPDPRIVNVSAGACSEDLIYDRCAIAQADPISEMVVIYDEGTNIADTLVASCTDIPFNVFSFDPPPVISVNSTDVQCNGDMSGAIYLSVSGVAPFCFDWAHVGGSCPGG